MKSVLHRYSWFEGKVKEMTRWIFVLLLLLLFYLVRVVLLVSLLSETDGRHGNQFHPPGLAGGGRR